MRAVLSMAAFGLASLLAVGAAARPAPKLKVLTTFLPVYCFTANVAGDLAEVTNLLPGPVDPHDYNFSRRDLQKIKTADLIIINGLGLESWLDRLIRTAGPAKTVVAATAGMDRELITGAPNPDAGAQGQSPADQRTGVPNPHVWLDPRLAARMVTNIQAALQQADPADRDRYARNARAYLERLSALDEEIARALEPVKGTPLVTYHDAFPYFARRYQLRVVGVVERVPHLEPTPRYLGELHEVIRTNQVKVLFTEPPQPSRLARQLARDLGLALAPLDTLESGAPSPTAYETGMRRNLAVLRRHLQ